ncbi:MAG TPA: hypothetical protein VKF82_03625 [Candidatus Eremiobacteraceae bacterium]|nr:hypothetical protein [Candidatus Eremiobacteraceae bacterium]
MKSHFTSGILTLLRRSGPIAAMLLASALAPALAAPPPVGIVTPNASVALAGQPISITVNVQGPGPINQPTILDFGDGSPPLALNPPYPKVASHAYANPGTYQLKLTIIGFVNPIGTATVTILNPASFSLTATPTSVIAGQAVNFTAVTGASIPGAFVDFGDGTSAPAPAPYNQLVHRYQTPAFYTARLGIVGQGVSFAQTQVSVSANSVNVPVGQIYSSFLVGSPVLAGADTAIALTYRIFTPFVIGSSGVSPLQAIVELTDSKGDVIQRSDPYALPFTQQNVNAPQTVMIPYTVPADAGGDYLIRVYVRVNTGGTVAVARAQPLQIIGGPDPAPKITNGFHASGAVLSSSGTNRGGYGVNMGLTTALQWSTEELLLTGTFDPVSKKIDPVVTFESATPAPVTAPAATSAPDATTSQVDSGHVPAPPTNGSPSAQSTPSAPSPEPGNQKTPEPAASVPPSLPTPTPSATQPPKAQEADSAAGGFTNSAAPASPVPAPSSAPPTGPSNSTGSAAEQAGPAVTPAPAPAPAPASAPGAVAPASPTLTYKDVVGRTDAAMPAVIGSKETLRGIDASYALQSGWTFHGGGGYFQLPSNTTTERTGELLDVIRAWDSGADSFRVAFSRNQDDVNKFVQTGTTGPLDVTAGVFEYAQQLTPHIRALLTGGRSNTQPETDGMPAYDDTVDQADVVYNVGATTFDMQYHNAGPQFGTLSGASALSDRAGGGATLNLTTSPISTLALVYNNDLVRSVFSRTTNTNATFNIVPPKWPGVTVGLERDTALAPGSDALTKTLNFGISKTGVSSVTISGILAAVSDSLAPEAYSTTRTGVVTYQYANGAHTFGAGLNATDTTSAASTGTVTESLNYGFSFGGHAPPNPNGLPLPPSRSFETKFVLSNVNLRALTSGGHTATLTGLLSWHVTPQLAPGVEFNYQRHYDNDPILDSETSFARFRLDVNI